MHLSSTTNTTQNVNMKSGMWENQCIQSAHSVSQYMCKENKPKVAELSKLNRNNDDNKKRGNNFLCMVVPTVIIMAE